jgi:hypothetical protein
MAGKCVGEPSRGLAAAQRAPVRAPAAARGGDPQPARACGMNSSHFGPTGLPYPDAADSLNDMLRYERLRGSVAGFFDAVGTALECLAAVLIVVARAPFSVQRADFTQ